MITSEYGLCPLEHLNTPCGLDELAAGLYPTRLEDISSVPFAFLRGVKTGGDSWQTADMMRGEETELFGLCERPLPNALYVLPGSHSKWIHTDEAGRIADFSTQLTGELIHAVASDTILKEAVSLSRQAADAEYLENGYAYACRNGVSAAFFKVRVLKNSFGIRDDRLFSFFVGAALAPEIEHMLALRSERLFSAARRSLNCRWRRSCVIYAFGEKHRSRSGRRDRACRRVRRSTNL